MNRYPVEIALFRGWKGEALRVVPRLERYRFEVRTLTRREFRNWQLLHPEPVDFEDRVLQETVLAHPAEYQGEPWDWDRVLAALPTRVAQEVLYLSGFGPHPHPLIMERVQNYLESEESRYDQLILVATDAYRLEELFDMHPEEYHQLVAHAQWKLSLLGMDPDIILDPPAYEKKMAEHRRAAMLQQHQARVSGFRPGQRTQTMPEKQMVFTPGTGLQGADFQTPGHE